MADEMGASADAGRLEAAGRFSAMVSHCVRRTRLDEVDGEVEAWLRAAYERAGT